MSSRAGASLDVCLTNPFAWPQVKRGSETLVRSLSSWLQLAGKRVEIVAGGPTARTYELDGVPVTLVKARSMQGVHRDLDVESTIIPGLARHLRQTKPAAVHSFMYVDATAARLAARPYVVSYGGIATRRSGQRHPLKRKLFRFASEGASVILCPSEAAAAHLYDTYGYHARVVPNGFSIAEFPVGLTDRGRSILCTATPDDSRKRVQVLVDAFAIVHRTDPGLDLLLAGQASDDVQRALLDRVPGVVQRKVRFLGDLGREELRDQYQRATITCLPSVNEAFGLVLIESMACGTPVVAACSGAIPEIIDDQVGALFAPDDPRACAAALLQVLEQTTDPAIHASCRTRAERYDWSVIGPTLLDIYDEVAA